MPDEIEGYNMQATGAVPYNPYNQSYGYTSPYDAFMWAGYDPESTQWNSMYEQEGMGAFEGSGVQGYDPSMDEQFYGENGPEYYGFDPYDSSTYDPDQDFNDYNATQPPAQSGVDYPGAQMPTEQAGPALPEPPMPPWMQNLASGEAFKPWSVIYDNPTPFASKEQWNSMNPSEQRGMMGSIPEYQREDFQRNMQQAFVRGVDKNSATSYIS